jgi:hypothetical protein
MKASVFQRGLLLGAALLVGMPLSAAAKCRDWVVRDGYEVTQRPKTVLVLDGHQRTEAELNALNLSNDSVQAIHILCWNPADSTFSMTHDTVLGVNLIRITTKGLVDRLVAELYRVSEASRSGTSQPAAGGSPTSRGASDNEIAVELTADGTQWSATLKQGALVHRCVLDVGTPAPWTTSERQRTCAFSIAEGEKFALTTEG